MGCINSSPDDGVSATNAEMVPTGSGGSMVIASGGRSGPPRAAEARPDLEVSKGGSYVLGRKHADDWEPGAVIDRPPNTVTSHVDYIPTPSGMILRLQYACVSEQGRSPRPPHKPNQDSWLALAGLGGDDAVALYAVFDGHGPKGEDASHYCRINLPDVTVRQALYAREPAVALEKAFKVVHEQFIAPATVVDTSVSGTTAIAVMFRGLHWTCANVGDSRAIMGSLNSKGDIVARPLSSDHKPTRPDERARVSASRFAKILSERALGIEGGDPDKYYICRVHNGSIRYGVLFTRSIGDADAHAFLGLSAEPEMKKGTLDVAKDKFIVIASDGVWDYVSDDQVAAIVARTPDDAQAAVEAVASTARHRWDVESEHRRDDITALVILFSLITPAAAEEERARSAAAVTLVHVDDDGTGAGVAASDADVAIDLPTDEHTVEDDAAGAGVAHE